MLTGGQGGDEPYRVGAKPSMPNPPANIFETWNLLDLDVEFVGSFFSQGSQGSLDEQEEPQPDAKTGLEAIAALLRDQLPISPITASLPPRHPFLLILLFDSPEQIGPRKPPSKLD